VRYSLWYNAPTMLPASGDDFFDRKESQSSQQCKIHKRDVHNCVLCSESRSQFHKFVKTQVAVSIILYKTDKCLS